MKDKVLEGSREDGRRSLSSESEGGSLAESILTLFSEDQEARGAITSYAEHLVEIDRRTQSGLTRIIEEYGFPSFSQVGTVAGRAFASLVAHTDVAFMKAVLPDLGRMVAHNEAAPEDYALLFDKVCVSEGKPQRWGTQLKLSEGRLVPYPIDMPLLLEERRREVGLMSMATYLQIVADLYEQ